MGGGSKTVLRERNVALVCSSSVISAIGTGAMFVALPYYTYVATGSVVATALVTLAEYAPTVGIAQLAGVLVDRWEPRGVLIAVSLAMALCTLAYLLHQGWWWLAVVAFVRSSVAQFAPPAAHTLVPAVAPPGRLAEVNALNAIGSNIARLAGPALGGVLVGVGGLHTVVIFDAATFVVAGGLTAGVRLTQRAGRAPADGLVRLWREGWSTVRHHSVLRPLVTVMALVGFGEGFVSALLAPWMIEIAGGGGAELGLMLSLQAFGGILGGVLVIRWADRCHSLSLLGGGAIVSGVFLVAIFNYPLVAPVGPWPAIILTAFAGLPFAVYGTAQAIAVQVHSTDGLRGRIVSLTFGVQGIAQLIGIAVAGPMACLVGPLAINAEAIAYLAAGAVALKTLRRGPRDCTAPHVEDSGDRTLARVTADQRSGGLSAAQAAAARALTWVQGPQPGVQLINAVLQVIARLAPSHDPVAGVEEHLDLSYGSAPSERLDLYRPEGGQEALPVVVWAHGGAWVGGDKSDVGFYLRLLAVEGYACVAINYGLAPESNYPEPVRQTGLALAWLAEHATSYGLDPDRVVLAGSSAGAQISAQYAAVVSDQAYAADVGIEPVIDRSQLVGTVLHCGPYDPATTLLHRGWRGWYARTVGWAYLGSKDFSAPQVQQASVVTHVTAAYPATLLTAGEKDSLSPQAHAFAARLAELGVPHEALWYSGVDHEFQLDLYRPEAQEVLAVTLRFLREHTDANTPSASG